MFLLVASALAGSMIGFPCQRLNWGWRNVWSTCSIFSWAPAATSENAAQIPTGFRTFGAGSPLIGTAPTAAITANGWYAPSANNVPLYFCNSAAATGTGLTANLRNRCRRAVDAYGALVVACQRPPATAGNRGPNTLNTPDWAPQTGHQPHVTNVQGLTQNAQFCLLPSGTVGAPSALNTPVNTCPGLLGWFTVVYNACGFTNAPGLAPVQAPNTPYVASYFPIGNVVSASVLPAGAVSPTNGAGYFCSSPNAASPSNWNTNGATFRTSRCRKALDQFGRTATRCHFSSAPLGTSPAQAGGWTDPLRVLAVGTSTAQGPVQPMGMNIWAPACN